MNPRTAPHGGQLRQLWCDPADQRALALVGQQLPSEDLSLSQLGELELLLDGALSPLLGYHTRNDFDAVRQDARLADGTPWPVPISLTINPTLAADLHRADRLGLRDQEGLLIGIVDVTDLWQDEQDQWRVGGPVVGIERARHHDFPGLWETPTQVREHILRTGWDQVICFATDSVLNRAEHAMLEARARDLHANVLIQLAATIPDPGDMTHYARVRAAQQAMQAFLPQTARLMMRPGVALRAEPKQLMLRLIIAQNYGCTHLVHMEPFPEPAGATELNIQCIAVARPPWSSRAGRFVTETDQQTGEAQPAPTERELFDAMEQQRPIPAWWSWPSVLRELQMARPPRRRQGFTLLFTGLSGSGKSTVAKSVMARLLAVGTRRATLLDGDVVRRRLSAELGFSREHRDLNVLRIGFVAAEITKFGGIAICAPIAPYAATRAQVRTMVEAHGGFVEVHVSTPLEVCERRDRKGLYAKARRGDILEFTGISDPYEVPEHPELRIDTTATSVDEAVQQVILKLQALGYLASEASGLQ